MKEKFKKIALEVGGSHYPDVGGSLLEKFGEMVVLECIRAIQEGDFRSVTYTTYDIGVNPRVINHCVNLIKENFKE